MKKFLFALVFVLLVAGLIVAYRFMSKERAAERDREKPVSSESKLTRNSEGETVLTMDEETQKRIGLKIAPLAAKQLGFELKGYGRVMDPSTLITLVADSVSARAIAVASQKEVERLKVLAAQDNTSARAVQNAEAASIRDNTFSESARHHLLLAWGRGIASHPELTELIEALAAGEKSLVRLELSAGELLSPPPPSARLFVLSDQSKGVEANCLGTAPAVDSQTQGQAFFFLTPSSLAGFTPGAAVLGFIKTPSEAQNGVVVPGDAVTRFNGKSWIYVSTNETNFLRKEISMERPLQEGWFASRGLKAGENVVVGGAQLLLSEEQKAQIHLGD